MQRAVDARRGFLALTVLAAVACLHLAWFIEDASRAVLDASGALPESSAATSQPAPSVRQAVHHTPPTSSAAKAAPAVAIAAARPPESPEVLELRHPPFGLSESTARPPTHAEPSGISPSAAAAVQEIAAIRSLLTPTHLDRGESGEFAATLAQVIAANEQAPVELPLVEAPPVVPVGRSHVALEAEALVESTEVSRVVSASLLQHAASLEDGGHPAWADRLRGLAREMQGSLPPPLRPEPLIGAHD